MKAILKATIMLSLIVGLAWCARSAPAEEGHWAKIRAFLEEYEEAKTPEARKAVAEAAEKYLKSLTAEQLIVAGRQCAREVENDPKDPRHEGAIAMGFFYVRYPPAADDLRDISPILQEIRDKTQPALWRRQLIGFLLTSSKWSAKLNNDQRQQVFDCVETILNDKADSIYVRSKIPTRLSRTLLKMYKDYGDASQDDAQDNQTEREKTLKEFTERVGKYLENNLKLFSDPTTPLTLRQRLLIGAVFCYQQSIPGSGGTKEIVLQAFANYRDYPEGLWQQLARYAMEDFHVTNADDVLDQMIRETSDESLKGLLQYQKKKARKRKTTDSAKE
ncbi:MAG: hypothetical protein HQ567_20715 [Candidatus Nealsonbacteria bacterium]|nr:hypothetical protein [Candidatus Nealsonbacteria bacterium]